jgi:L-alanine-DL-glutamate epimerase-like enolase superfamily enzyme
MIITGVKVFLLQKQLNSSMRISRGGFSVRNHAIVQVQTDEGIMGLGEGVGSACLIKAIIEGQMEKQAVGLNPFDIELLRHKLIDNHVYLERKGSVICAASAIEMACWDIKGKALDIPVYQLLGGLYRDRIEAYASDVYWEDEPEVMGENAKRIVNKGFRTIKAHVGCESPTLDFERVKALRESVGNDINLMIDLNGGYSGLEAYQAARLWEEFNLFWLEEPLSPNQLDALADLRSRIRVPIAAGENEFRLHGFKELFDKNAVDVAMPDIARVGGLQETKNICILAEAYGILVSPHNFSSGILLAATIHLMASTPNTTLLEYDTSDNAVYEDLLIEPLSIEDGYLKVPSHPGLGVKLRNDVLEQYAVS